MKKLIEGLIEKLGNELVIKLINEFLTEENIKKAIDGLFDSIEDFVSKSGTNIDDITVLPILKRLRDILNVPDNDN